MKNTKGPYTKTSSTKEFIMTRVSQEIDRCIRCNRCIEVCPVTKPRFTIKELNEATKSKNQVPEKIKKFTFSCVQCRRCVPVCSMGLHRDEMMLFLRYKLRTMKPYGYKRYLAIRGPNLTPIARTAQGIHAAMKMKKAPDLARYMESIPSQPAPILFYPGCYIYSFETIRRTKRLMDHVGIPYTILGGLTTCCGIPQLLQGEFDLADRYMTILHEKIQMLNPSIVLTGCAECLEALLLIKETCHDTFEVYTIVEYLQQHIQKFPAVKVRNTVTLHDSCRLTRRYHRGDATRKAIKRFSTLVEMKNSGNDALCCFHWNHDYDVANKNHRLARLTEAKEQSSTMVCDCITCYEEFQKLRTDVQVIDVLHLFEEALEKSKTT